MTSDSKVRQGPSEDLARLKGEALAADNLAQLKVVMIHLVELIEKLTKG